SLTRKIVLASSNGSSSTSSRIAGGPERPGTGFAAAALRALGLATVTAGFLRADAGLRTGARFAPVERLRAAAFRAPGFGLARLATRPPARVARFGLAFFAGDLEPRFFFDAMLGSSRAPILHHSSPGPRPRNRALVYLRFFLAAPPGAAPAAPSTLQLALVTLRRRAELSRSVHGAPGTFAADRRRSRSACARARTRTARGRRPTSSPSAGRRAARPRAARARTDRAGRRARPRAAPPRRRRRRARAGRASTRHAAAPPRRRRCGCRCDRRAPASPCA